MSKVTAVEWFSDEAYKLFESYSEGKIDRKELNRLMTAATIEAKAMEKEQIIDAYEIGFDEGIQIITKYDTAQDYYNETYEK